MKFCTTATSLLMRPMRSPVDFFCTEDMDSIWIFSNSSVRRKRVKRLPEMAAMRLCTMPNTLLRMSKLTMAPTISHRWSAHDGWEVTFLFRM